MTVVFADTGYWLAITNPRDGLHQRALRVSEPLQGALIVTTEMVLAEWLNNPSRSRPEIRMNSAAFVRRLRANQHVEIVPQTAAQFRSAFERYASRSDKAWSLTDCASFVEMERRGIEAALTHDRHFEQAGFRALLR